MDKSPPEDSGLPTSKHSHQQCGVGNHRLTEQWQFKDDTIKGNLRQNKVMYGAEQNSDSLYTLRWSATLSSLWGSDNEAN